MIIYTTSTLSKDVLEAFKKGASLYLPKIDSEREMIETVQYLASIGREEWQCPRKERFCYCPKMSIR